MVYDSVYGMADEYDNEKCICDYTMHMFIIQHYAFSTVQNKLKQQARRPCPEGGSLIVEILYTRLKTVPSGLDSPLQSKNVSSAAQRKIVS